MTFSHELSRDVFVYITAIGVVLTNGFLLGSFVLARIPGVAVRTPPEFDRAEWIFLSSAVGLGLIACLTLPLGVVLPYSSILYRLGHGLLLAAGVIWWKRSGVGREVSRLALPPWQEVPGLEKIVWLLIGLTFAYSGFLSMHAIEGSDGQTLHLKAVLLWEDSHHYVPQVTLFDGLPHTVGDEQTQSGRLLLLNVSLLGNVFATGAFNTALLAIGCAGVYALGCRFFERRTALFGLLIFLTNPVVFRYYLWDVTDYTLNLVVFLALAVTLALAIRGSDQRWLRVSAVLGGILFGIKAYALLQIPLLALFVAPMLYRKKLLGAAGRELPWFFLFAAPWVVHNWILFHNPIWPHLNGLFGGHPLNALFKIWTETRPYSLLHRYFASGASTYLAALIQFWRDQLFPPLPFYDFAFSPLLVPSIGVFAVAACWRRVFLLPLVFAVGFLAVALNTPQLFNKYMILIAAPTAPFLAAILLRVLAPRAWMSTILATITGAAILWVAWDAVSLANRGGDLFAYPARARGAEPQQTLDKLPASALVFGNFVGMDNRYTRVYWHFRYVSDTSELLCDDWRQLWEFYKSKGVTHYLVNTKEADVFGYDSVLPEVSKFNPPLSDYIKSRQAIFERNKQVRDQYLAEKAKRTDLGGGYILYELN